MTGSRIFCRETWLESVHYISERWHNTRLCVWLDYQWQVYPFFNVCDLHSGNSRFETGPRHWLPLFEDFLFFQFRSTGKFWNHISLGYNHFVPNTAHFIIQQLTSNWLLLSLSQWRYCKLTCVRPLKPTLETSILARNSVLYATGLCIEIPRILGFYEAWNGSLGTTYWSRNSYKKLSFYAA
jgi:hypothetical protein